MEDPQGLLVAYVDGELDAATAREVERLIETDPQARRTVALYRQTASLLRAACGEACYAEGADALLPAAPAPARRLGRRSWAIAACAAAAVGGFGAGALWPRDDGADLIDELAEYHQVFSRETDHLAEIPAERSAELSAWLGSRLQRRLVVPDLAAAGLRFAGGRMLVAAGRPVAELMYTRDHGLPVALCITQRRGRPAPLRLDQRGALRVASWRDGGLAYFVLGELDEAAVRDIALRAAVQLHG